MLAATALMIANLSLVLPTAADRFAGRYFSGAGDVEYLQLLDIARRMLGPDPEFQNVPMLYTPEWNGLVEGPTWNMWWIQNSYGPTYCALPFYEEPLVTFLRNAQDLWFDQMGDGRTPRPFQQHGGKRFDWVPPNGCLCDAARPGRFVAKQGDGKVEIHDWGFEFTAAGMLVQAELLLICRDREAIDHYMPKLERCANFIETRRDPKNNLFLVGPAANLLAPSYAGWKRDDGTYDKAYLTGLSVTYVAALDRLIELYKLIGDHAKVDLYQERRDTARAALKQLTTDESYLIKSLDPDGTPHGVFGAERHGYFEASPNHDAIAFRVVNEQQAERIYEKIASIPGLRPHHFILPNYPGLDDLYTEPTGLWRFGHWVNGGHWSTCEARMMMAYYRLSQFDDARRSMQQLLTFARRFRMDNPLTDFGHKVYQPNRPINLCYDSFGPPAALIRGLFEYLYRADGLTLIPHIPPGITELRQQFPVRFGRKKLYLATLGSGEIRQVFVNSQPWNGFTSHSVTLPYDRTPDVAKIELVLGAAQRRRSLLHEFTQQQTSLPAASDLPSELRPLHSRLSALEKFCQAMRRAGLENRYEAAHARLAIACAAAAQQRQEMLAAGRLTRLPDVSQEAADASYVQTTYRLTEGLEQVLDGYVRSKDPHKRRVSEIWRK